MQALAPIGVGGGATNLVEHIVARRPRRQFFVDHFAQIVQRRIFRRRIDARQQRAAGLRAPEATLGAPQCDQLAGTFGGIFQPQLRLIDAPEIVGQQKQRQRRFGCVAPMVAGRRHQLTFEQKRRGVQTELAAEMAGELAAQLGVRLTGCHLRYHLKIERDRCEHSGNGMRRLARMGPTNGNYLVQGLIQFEEQIPAFGQIACVVGAVVR